MNQEQAAQIHDLESYKEITGAKRFKRTKEEMSLGLSPEEALERRLLHLREPQSLTKSDTSPMAMSQRPSNSEGSRRASTSRKGDIVLRIRPQAGVDPEFFERLTSDVEIVMDEKWYSWLDTRLGMPYDGDMGRLLEDMLNLGIGEVIDRKQFPEDLDA